MNSPTAAKVVVVGSVNLDTVLHLSRLPTAGETRTGATLFEAVGGKGANQAVAAARLGATVAFVGCTGDDAAGRTGRLALEQEGIDLRHCGTNHQYPTGRATVAVADDGENSIIVADGANGMLSPSDIDQASELIMSARILLCQLEIPVATVARAMSIARSAGTLTCLNTAPAVPLDALSSPPDILIANRIEAESLTGVRRRAPEELAAALQRRYGATSAVVTDGARGAVAVDRRGRYRAAALAVDVRDTTGAGDAFAGALVAQLAQGAELPDALPIACAAGSLAASQPGAMPSLPHQLQLNAALAPRRGQLEPPASAMATWARHRSD